jgi:hypothetical protein
MSQEGGMDVLEMSQEGGMDMLECDQEEEEETSSSLSAASIVLTGESSATEETVVSAGSIESWQQVGLQHRAVESTRETLNSEGSELIHKWFLQILGTVIEKNGNFVVSLTEPAWSTTGRCKDKGRLKRFLNLINNFITPEQIDVLSLPSPIIGNLNSSGDEITFADTMSWTRNRKRESGVLVAAVNVFLKLKEPVVIGVLCRQKSNNAGAVGGRWLNLRPLESKPTTQERESILMKILSDPKYVIVQPSKVKDDLSSSPRKEKRSSESCQDDPNPNLNPSPSNSSKKVKKSTNSSQGDPNPDHSPSSTLSSQADSNPNSSPSSPFKKKKRCDSSYS